MVRVSFIGALLLLLACGGKSVDRAQELDALIEQNEVDEVLARVQLYMDQGEETGTLYFARGWAELQQDADKPARASFAEAVRLAPEYSKRIAELWREKALVDHEAKWYDRAGKRMREAFRYDHDIALEPEMDSVADQLYRYEKDFASALLVFERLREKTSANFNKRMEWEFRYGHCLEELGRIDDALAAYSAYLDKFPEDTGYTAYVTWRWMMVHKEQAEEALERGDLDAASQWIVKAPLADWHMDLQQEIRLVAGKIHEARGEYEEALSSYEQILADGATFGGQVVADAKDRIDAIHALGVH